jgi:hypothetical protein
MLRYYVRGHVGGEPKDPEIARLTTARPIEDGDDAPN